MSTNLSKNKSNEELIVFLQEYARDSLSQHNSEIIAALNRRQIPTQQVRQLEEAYQIVLRTGNNIPLRPLKKLLIPHIEAVSSFLRDFQIGVLGQRSSIFQIYEVELKVDDCYQYQLVFEAGKLLIQIPYWQISFLSRKLKYKEIKKRWQKGEHLPEKSPTRKLWWLINPIGEFRSNLRSLLMLAVRKRILNLDQLLVKFGIIEGDTREDLPAREESKTSNRLQSAAITFLKKATHAEKLGVDLEVILKDKDQETLGKLLERFKANLADPNQIEDLIDTSTLSLQQAITQEESAVDIKMFGFVNVGNYHRIDVDLNLSAGYLKKYVEVIPRKADVKAVQFGFVNVYTIDDITVTPNLHNALKVDVETAALEKALQDLKLIEQTN